MMKQYEQFLQNVCHFEIKPTHIFSSVQERRAQITRTDDFSIFTFGGNKTNTEILITAIS